MIRDDWESYRRSVVPRNASPVQVQECRRAFYAGAHCLLIAVTQDLPALNDEDADAALVALIAEATAFKIAVEKGDA